MAAPMNPLSPVAWGSKETTSRLSFYIGLQISSVLVPGIVVVSGLALIAARLASQSGSSVLTGADTLSNLQGPALILILTIGVSVGYIVGWISRELGFWIVGQVEGREWIRTATSSLDADAADSAEPANDDTDAFADLDWAERLSTRDRLSAVVAAEVLHDCADRHPILGYLEQPSSVISVAGVRRAGRHWNSFISHLEYESFVYCKLWLRAYAPQLSVDRIEADINVLAASLVPVSLFAANTVAWSTRPLVATIAVIPIFIAITALIVRRIVRNRKDERWEAVRNVVHDHMMRSALVGYQESEAFGRQGNGGDHGPLAGEAQE